MDTPHFRAFRDTVPAPRGWFQMRVFRHGRLIERVSERNLIVVGARTINAGILGGLIAGPGLTQIGYGASMVAPQFGNTTLTTPFVRPLDGVGYPGLGMAAFAFSLGADEANGLQIGEFGLLSAAGVLFARKTRAFALIPKDASISLSGTWTIQY